MRLDAKTAKANADKSQLFAESVERHFGIQSDNFDSKHFDGVIQFIEDNYVYFYPTEDPDDYRMDMDDDHDLVADIDSVHSLGKLSFLSEIKLQTLTTYTTRSSKEYHGSPYDGSVKSAGPLCYHT